MKQYKLPYKTLPFLFSGLCLLAAHIHTSQAQNTGGKTETPATAYFDFFTYKGEDPFYAENALPGKAYFYNPVLPGWYSDPSICTNGEEYFLVTSTFVYYPGVPIFHSRDLVNWKQTGHVLDRPSQLINLQGQHTSGGIFAPAIEYNPHNKTYYMITTNVGAGNFFVKTKDPFGPWSDPIMLKDVSGIDPSFFFDDNGKAYILNNDAPEGPALYDGHRAIRIREFDVEADNTFRPDKVLVDGGIRPDEKPVWIEGPHMYKINGKYFLMAAEGGTGPNHSEVILKGDTPMGDFTPWDKNPILTQRHLDSRRPNPITCAGHADLIQTKEGDWWAVFLATRPINNEFENLGRETFLMPVRWSEDGFPFMTQGEEVIPMIVKRDGVEKSGKNTFGNFEKNEDFDSGTLADYWMKLRAPAENLYSLTEKQGYLALKCADVKATEKKTPAFICRRMQHHHFEVTTRLLFNPEKTNDAAGLLLYKDEIHQYFMSVRKTYSGRKVSVEKISKVGTEILGEKSVSGKGPVNLKVVSEGLHYNFYFSTGKRKSWETLYLNADARFLSTANSFGFTGTTMGMYASGKE